MVITKKLLQESPSSLYWLDNWKLHYTIPTFQQALQDIPLTQENVEGFLEKNVVQISFSDDFGGASICPDSRKPLTYRIAIGTKNSDVDDQCISLVHEIIHGFYRVKGRGWGSSPVGKSMEEIIEQNAKLFYTGNRNFVREIVQRYRTI